MPAIATFSDSAGPASGIVALAAQAATTIVRQPLSLRAEDEADERRVELASGGAPCATSATAPCGREVGSGTRKIEPVEARSAFGPNGSAQPGESAR